MRACKVEMHLDMSEEPLCLEIYRKSAQAQNLDAHFVRACTVDMHVNISQEPLYTEIYRKNAAPQSQPRTQTVTLHEPAQSKCMSPFHKSHFIRKFRSKMPHTKPAAHTFRERAQSTCMSTCHKSHFIRKFTGKMPGPRMSALIKHRPLHLPQEPLSVDTLFGELTVRTPECGHTVWGTVIGITVLLAFQTLFLCTAHFPCIP